MPQLHCYVPEELAQQAQRRAAQAGLSLELIKRDASAGTGWPEGYFDLFVPIEGAELERPPQGKPTERERLE